MVEDEIVEARTEPRLFFRRLAWYRRRVEALEEQTVIDDLTGLRNQRALWRELTRRAATCSKSSPLTLVMIGFDLFREVNETYGHAVGDAVLQRAASVLRSVAPSPRLAFRYSGEEFALLLPGDEADGRELAERVRAGIARENGSGPAVTVSCGVAELDSPVEPWVALDRVDAALHDAKRLGRNCVAVASQLRAGSYAEPAEDLEHETARRAALAVAITTLEARDSSTAEHSDDVLTLCEAIGRELGFDGRELERLMAGAQLHDVGKVAVPSEILNKPGPLNAQEWAVIREHTVIGERILRSVPEMAEVATIVRHSHEHWDGGGYPDGLVGEQIPLPSRVILCADAFHAIRSDRPYRTGRPAGAALDEVRGAAGTQFDPAVVAALVRVVEDVRSGGVGRMLPPRRKRLVALLATLAIGSGSAFAAIPDLRDAVASLFGASTGTTEVVPTAAGADFSFGPLGDVLSIAPAAGDRRAGERAVVPRAAATREARRPARPRASEGGGAMDSTRARRPAGGGSAPRSRAAPSPSPGGPGARGTPGSPDNLDALTPAPAPTAGGTTPGTTDPGTGGGGTDDGTGGRGRGLGKTLPTPRKPAQPPSQNGGGADGVTGRPQAPGRADPPAIGRETGPAPNGKGKAGRPTS